MSARFKERNIFYRALRFSLIVRQESGQAKRVKTLLKDTKLLIRVSAAFLLFNLRFALLYMSFMIAWLVSREVAATRWSASR